METRQIMKEIFDLCRNENRYPTDEELNRIIKSKFAEAGKRGGMSTLRKHGTSHFVKIRPGKKVIPS